MEITTAFLISRKLESGSQWHCPDEAKAQIVVETLRPGTKANEIAERYGLGANRLSTWRTMARVGDWMKDVLDMATQIDAFRERSMNKFVNDLARSAANDIDLG